MNISIVIPCYNEEANLAACLESIALQTIKPVEVIVVDNGSTDASAAVAASFPFVTLLNEARQGVVYARNRGFDAASGDIVGRIDADTLLDTDWVERALQIFLGGSVDAVSGSVDYYDMTLPKVAGQIDLLFRRWLAKRLAKEQFLYGANMALRRTAWIKVRSQVCALAGIHEDFDLALHLQDAGHNVIFDERLHASVALRILDSGFVAFWRYCLISPATYAFHGKRLRIYMYPVIGTALGFYWFLILNHKLRNPRDGSVSFKNLIVDAGPRVNPATYVD